MQRFANKILDPMKKIAHTVNAPFKVLANITDTMLKSKKKEIQIEEDQYLQEANTEVENYLAISELVP